MTTVIKPSAAASLSYWTEKAVFDITGWAASMSPAEAGDIGPVVEVDVDGWNVFGGSRPTETGGTWFESGTMTRTIEGLTVGVTYRIETEVVLPVNRSITVSVDGIAREVKGIATSNPASHETAWAGDAQTAIQQRFVAIEWVATAPSAVLTLVVARLPQVQPPISTSTIVEPWDVMTKIGFRWRDVVLRERHDAAVPLEVTAAAVTMDSTWSPYVQAPVTCKMPQAADLAALDPLAETRVLLTASDLEGGSDRTWDLSLRGVEDDDGADTVTLTLESDEALLREYTPAFHDQTPFDLATDLRNVVEYVVSTAVPNADITLPADPIDVQPRWDATNLLRNPTFGPTTIHNLVVDNEFKTVFGDVWKREGSAGTWEIVDGELWLNAATGAANVAYNDCEIPVQPGEKYILRGEIYTESAAVSLDVGAITSSNSWALWAANLPVTVRHQWTKVETEFTVPANASWLRVYFRAPGGGTGISRLRSVEVVPVNGYRIVPRGWTPTVGTVASPSLNSLRHTLTYAGGVQRVMEVGHPATPGRRYYARADVRRSNAGRIWLGMRFRREDGTVITGQQGAWATGFSVVANGTFVPVEAWAVAPPEAASVDFGVQWDNVVSGEIADVANPLLAESELPLPFFSGNTADDADYTYLWDGPPTASPSSRRPVTPRPAEALIWSPGTSAWSFLEQLLYSTGYRLWCDENRQWHLTPDDAAGETGTITVDEATDARGASSRDTEDYAGTIILTYRWTDPRGVRRSETVVAGRRPPMKAYTFDDTPYPGGNPAERILAAAQVAGRTRTVTAPVDYTTTPGMTLALALPGTSAVTGTIRRVDFDLATGLMTIEAHKIQET